ncbi:MAG TPA: hypothetical protein PKN89_02950, partial [Anaerolineaceae bacterium]|nr:hypothetical protein [Anaerolineaceae bacterium]
MRRIKQSLMISIIIILSILLGACGSLTQPAMPAEPVLPAESPTPEPITTKLPPTPEPTPAAIVPMVWLDPRLPEELQAMLGEL